MKISMLILALILCAFSSTAVSSTLTAETKLPAWNAAYRDFLLEKQYLTSGQDFGTEIVPAVSLYDMDRDGVPELVISNGYTGRAVRCAYVYSYVNEAVTYLGIGPTDGFYAPDSTYSGIFGYFHISGEDYSWTYYWKNGSEYGSERICLLTDSVYSEKTDDTALLALAQDESSLIPLPHIT